MEFEHLRLCQSDWGAQLTTHERLEPHVGRQRLVGFLGFYPSLP